MFDIKGKNAIITGGTKGIGRAIAEAYAQAGANVCIVSRTKADCEKTAQDLTAMGAKALSLPTDITDYEAFDKTVREVEAVWGSVDILVNNAGSVITKPSINVDEVDWDRVLDLDLKAVFFCAKAVGRVMIANKRGKIINLSSIMGIVGSQQILPYNVAKGGVLQLTRALALEWARYNIQVNSICPGYLHTEINDDFLKDPKNSEGILKKIPMRRFGTVAEMQGAAIFLASGASDYMTGQQLVIDGGWTAQ